MEEKRLNLEALEKFHQLLTQWHGRQATWNQAIFIWLVLLSAAVVALWIFK